MTKGEAANIITRLKHGAQVCPLVCNIGTEILCINLQKRHDKNAKARKRAEDKQAKEEMRAAREFVQVGPLPVAATGTP